MDPRWPPRIQAVAGGAQLPAVQRQRDQPLWHERGSAASESVDRIVVGEKFGGTYWAILGQVIHGTGNGMAMRCARMRCMRCGGVRSTSMEDFSHAML